MVSGLSAAHPVPTKRASAANKKKRKQKFFIVTTPESNKGRIAKRSRRCNENSHTVADHVRRGEVFAFPNLAALPYRKSKLRVSYPREGYEMEKSGVSVLLRRSFRLET